MVSFTFLNASVDASTIVFIVLLVVMIVALLVVPMFTNKKRAKQAEEQYRSLRPGTLIKTVGGIIGTVKEIRQVSPQDREMIIETGEGDNKTTMTFDIMALYQILSPAPSDEYNADNGEADDVFASDNSKSGAESVVADNAEENKPEESAKEQTEELATTDPVEPQSSADDNAVAEQSQPEAQAVEEQSDVADEEQTAAEAQPVAEKKPVAKKSTASGGKSSAAKKPAAKKPIAKNK